MQRQLNNTPFVQPQVSVILATYNRAHCLERAIQSVLTQTFRDFELLVVDDGSTDDTKIVVNSIADPRLRLISLEHNVGQSLATNHGVREARGEWIMLTDSDDRSLPERLQKQLRAANNEINKSPDGVFGRAAFIDAAKAATQYFPSIERSIDGDLALLDVLHNNTFGSGRVLVRRSAFLAVGGFDEKIRKSLDRDFIIRFLQHFRMIGINDVVIECLVWPDGLTSKPDPGSLRRTLEKNARAYQQLDRRKLSYQYRKVGEEYLELNLRSEAAVMLLISLKLHPNAEHRELYIRATKGRWFSPYGSAIYGYCLKLARKVRVAKPRIEHSETL